MTAHLGDYVRLEDGRTGQVWDGVPDRLGYVTVAVEDGTWSRVNSRTVDVVEPLTLPSATAANHAARIVQARRAHVCDDGSAPACPGVIVVGARYVRTAVFPGHVSGAADETGQPQIKRLCQPCAHQYDDLDPAHLQQKEPTAS